MEENWDDDACVMQQPMYSQLPSNNFSDQQTYKNRNSNPHKNYDRNRSSQNNYDRNSSSYNNYDKNNSSYNNYDRNRSSYNNYDRNNSSYNNDRSNSSYNNHDRNRKEKYSNKNFDTNEPQCNFFIETSKLGKLIGKGGSQIRELQEKTGTKINIIKERVEGDSTLVIVNGTEEAQKNVKSLIDELLCDKLPGSQSYEYETQNNAPEIEIDWIQASRDHDAFQKEKWAKYPAIKKNFYMEDPEIADMSQEEVDRIRKENNNIDVQYMFESDTKEGDSSEQWIPNPVQSFEQAFRNYPDILTEIAKKGFVKPSPIQCQAWPILLSGKDMIGIAQTGTGKTLAFLLPALIHIDEQETPRNERSGPTVLIMAPTRELALQIEKEVNLYYYHDIKALCVYGGGNRKEQMDKVSKGVEIIIATPGRLNDLVQTGILDVKCVSYLVLDEADRMLDMGFEPQIRKTMLDIRPDRQSVMTSATWPPGVRRLAQSYMKNPITVSVGSLDLKAVHSVTQKIYIIEEEDKIPYLHELFQNMGEDDKLIVFFGKKSKVDDIGSDLALGGVKCQSIHGGRDQNDREQAIEDIKSGEVHILLATDVASRGIDIPDITHVVNFDFPRDIEEYVHRVGRTGRAGRTGESISFMTRKDWGQAAELIKILEEAEQEIPEELYNMCERYKAMQKRKFEEKDQDRSHHKRYGGRGGQGGGGGGRNRYRNDF